MLIKTTKLSVFILVLGSFAAAPVIAGTPGSEPLKRSDLPLPVEVVGQDGPVAVTLDGELVNISGEVNATIDEPIEVEGVVTAEITQPLDVNVLSAPPSSEPMARPVGEYRTLSSVRGAMDVSGTFETGINPFSVLTRLTISGHVPADGSIGAPCYISVRILDPATGMRSSTLGDVMVGPGASSTEIFEFPEGLEVSGSTFVVMETFVSVGGADECHYSATANGVPVVFFNG